MARLILKYEEKVLKEIPLRATVAIGRVPGNDVVIDNLAVSSAHAKVYLENDRFVLEDLQSLNGTFVNHQRVRKTHLQHGDQILIGKHILVFDETGLKPEAAPPAEEHQVLVAKLRQTEALDTRELREFLQQATTLAEGDVSPGAVVRVGSLVMLSGKTDQKEYILTMKLAVIGKSPLASVKLKGWFKPQVAAAILNKGQAAYQLVPAGKAKVKLNGQALAGPQDLKGGDRIEVSGVKMQFNYRE